MQYTVEKVVSRTIDMFEKVTSRNNNVILLAFVLVSIIVGVLFGVLTKTADSSTADNLSGYAWSDTIGWISFNCTDTGTCATSPYGVNVSSTGALSGYAWSENIGWISFNTAEVGGCPSGTCAPQMNRTTGAVTGWARALSAPAAGGNAGGWDGFISLSGAGYGVTATACAWGGYAWGSDVVGWVSFSGAGYGVTGTGNACVNTEPDLVSSGLVVPPLMKAGTGISLSSVVTNNSTISINTPFIDDFSYQWDGTGGGWTPFDSNTVTHAGLAGNTSVNDALTVVVDIDDRDRTGDLYIQHCVDATKVIDEGPNENPNCTVSSAIRVIKGFINVDNTNLEYNETTNLTWGTTNTVGLICEVSGDGTIRTEHNGSEPSFTPSSSMTMVLQCGYDAGNLILIDQVGVSVNLSPELTASPRTVPVDGETVLNANTKGQTGCTLTGGTGTFDLTTGPNFPVKIPGRTTFTLTCPIGSDAVTVDVIGRGFET